MEQKKLSSLNFRREIQVFDAREKDNTATVSPTKAQETRSLEANYQIT